MKISTRSPLLWGSATLLSCLLYFFAFHFFPQTFPIINICITMDREQAIEKAAIIAQEHNFGPTNSHTAAMFHTDSTVKTFVELEAGGKDALITMMDEQLYMPYTWRVRHFKEHEKNETTIIFTPDGKPYGFVETLSENSPGEQLTEKDAQIIAEQNAAAHWNIDFTYYTLVETAQKLQPSNRLDHTFVYERTDKKINPPSLKLWRTAPADRNEKTLINTDGAGLYRLKIIVSGDKMTELTHFVKVPEAFTRRYTEMRSANTAIAWGATIIFGLLYILIGCGVGIFYLIKNRWYIVKQPLVWALFISALSVLTIINQLPSLWMFYHSAFSFNGFLLQILLRALIVFLLYSVALTLIITTAEGLTRAAFGHHPQLWATTNSQANTSYSIFGRVFGSYLLIGFNCAFVIGFYLFSTKYLNWWSPSEMLFDPNILATYVPWFSPIAQSLNAGFMEECVFRAIPLAGAALLGNYFGKRSWWIGAAFILQAVVFGAAHANYPMQPSYARLIELFLPSLIWGAIYIRFGLLTTIITHTVYDIIWFSLPIFVSQVPHAFAYQCIIIFIALSPLLYVISKRLQKGHWTYLPHSMLNAMWQPKPVAEKKEQPISTPTLSSTLTQRTKKIISVLGIIGFLLWIYATPFTHDGVTITLTRDDAIKTANMFLAEKNFIPQTPWKTLPLMFANYNHIPQIALQHTFIWKEGNKELYHQLLGNYLHPAHWTIRYAQFDSDIIARTEEHKVMLYNNNHQSIYQYYHQLPESASGAQLTQEEARNLALAAIKEQLPVDADTLNEISATSAQLPQRRDWLFIFTDPSISLAHGQARINVAIAGNETVNMERIIHVPEEWERIEQHKQNMLSIFIISFILIFIVMLLIALYLASKQNKLFAFSPRLFVILFGIFMILFSVDIINSWPNIIGAFNTSLPISHQLFQLITKLIISSLLKAISCAAIMSFILTKKKTIRLPYNWHTIMLGICSGLFLTGVLGAFQLLIRNAPLWPEYDALSCSWPLLATMSSALMNYIQLTILFSLLFIIVDATKQTGKLHRMFFTCFALVCGMLCIDLPSLDEIGLWILLGSLFGLLLLKIYQYVIRYDYALIPLATSSLIIFDVAQEGIFNAYPGAMFNNIVSGCVVGIISIGWYWYSSKQH